MLEIQMQSVLGCDLPLEIGSHQMPTHHAFMALQDFKIVGDEIVG